MISSSFLALLWLILAVILGIIEGVTIDLVAIWFALGAFVTVIPALFKLPLAFQVITFLTVSLLALIVFKPFAKKILHVRKVSTNADSIIGKMGIVTQNIDSAGDSGRVHVDGLDWKAMSDDGFPIEKDSHVMIKSIKGVTVMVEKI